MVTEYLRLTTLYLIGTDYEILSEMSVTKTVSGHAYWLGDHPQPDSDKAFVDGRH